MTEADLARPVVEVKDFSTGLTEYEIYTFGEENVIVPVDPDNEANQNNIYKLAESKIKDVIRRFDPNPEISIISDNKVRIKVQKDTIPRIIGKGGSTISELEDMLGVRIDVEMKTPTLGKEVYFEINESGNGVVIKLDEQTIGNKVNLYIDDEFICANQVGKKSRIKIDKRSESGRKILNAIIAGQKISIFQIDSRLNSYKDRRVKEKGVFSDIQYLAIVLNLFCRFAHRRRKARKGIHQVLSLYQLLLQNPLQTV